MLNGDTLANLLAELERRDLVRRQTVSAFQGYHEYSFNHVLVRDVAYELLPRVKRQERHRETALYLEQISAGVGEACAALARHWRDAGDKARAVDYFAAAAAAAESGWAKDARCRALPRGLHARAGNGRCTANRADAPPRDPRWRACTCSTRGCSACKARRRA